MAGKPVCDTGESKLETEQNRVFLTAITAAEDGVFPLGTHLAVDWDMCEVTASC